jgi:hypothetical protein
MWAYTLCPHSQSLTIHLRLISNRRIVPQIQLFQRNEDNQKILNLLEDEDLLEDQGIEMTIKTKYFLREPDEKY